MGATMIRRMAVGALAALAVAIGGGRPFAPSLAADGPYADRIRIGIVSPFRRVGDVVGTSPFPLSNMIVHAADIESEPVGRLLFRALYRYDSVLTPVPDLAAEPCEAGLDGLTLTCTVVHTTFSNGDVLTADDVAFTYRIAISEVCPFGPWERCPGEVVSSVDVLDPSTVRFTLRHPDPTFVTATLPNVWIDSRDVVESQYETFRSAASRIGSERLRTEVRRLDDALRSSSPDCGALRADAERFVRSLGLEPPDPAIWDIGPGRTFDACGFVGLLRDMLSMGADSLDLTGVDSIAVAYGILPLNWHPVGTGPWRIDEELGEPGRRLVLTASPTAERPPATPRIDVVSYPTRRDAAEGFRAGKIDWLGIPADWGGGVEQGGADLYRLVAGFEDVSFARYPDPTGYLGLGINVREGRVLADPNLRHALALCMDRRALVDAAYDGQAVAASTLVPSDIWAADPGVTVPARDVAAAKRLIEDSGWVIAGTTYQKEGEPLAAELWVQSVRPERVKLSDLLAYQAADCGMDIQVRVSDSEDFWMTYGWPHVPPGGTEPFDIYVAFGVEYSGDPDPLLRWLETREATSPDHEFGNDVGYSDPTFDTLMEQARSTYDIVERARLYRAAQRILADDLPVIPIWYRLGRVALRPGLTTVNGPLDLKKPGWDWRPDQLLLRTQGQ